MTGTRPITHYNWGRHVNHYITNVVLFDNENYCSYKVPIIVCGDANQQGSNIVLIFIVLDHWNSSLQIDMSPHSYKLSRFQANKSAFSQLFTPQNNCYNCVLLATVELLIT